MLTKGNKTQTIFSSPDFDFTVIASSGQVTTIGRVIIGCKQRCLNQSNDPVVMTLLFEDVGLWFPFPNKELSKTLGAHSDPVTSFVYAYAINFVLSDLEGIINSRLETLKFK